MDCKKTRKYLVQYAEGCLDARTAREAEYHLAYCPKCASELASYRKLVSAAAAIKAEDPGKEFWQGYLPSLREKLAVNPPWYDFFKKPIAASVSFALLLIFALSPLAAGKISRIARVRRASAITVESVVKKIGSNPEWLKAAIEDYQLASDASNVAEVLSSEEKDRLVAEMTAEMMD